MAFVGAGRNLLAGSTTVFSNVGRTVYPCIFDQVRHYAARVGTRLKKLKLAKQAKLAKTRKLLKMMEQRKRQELKRSVPLEKIRKDDYLLGPPVDDVWTWKRFQWPVYTLEEAINAFQETYHPTTFDIKNPNVDVFIELDLTGDKKGKFVKDFERIVLLPHKVTLSEERKIIAFSPQSKLYPDALAAGATVIGGKDLIREIQAGNMHVKDFDYHVADPAILPDLLAIKGLFGDTLPSYKRQTLDPEILYLIEKFKYGIEYTVTSHKLYPQYGTCTTVIGSLDMGSEKLASNLETLMQDIYQKKPRKRDTFVTRLQLRCLPSKESFKIDFSNFVPVMDSAKQSQQKNEDEEEDGRDTASVIVAND